MARGRMLNRAISRDKLVADLVAAVGGFGGLFYTWLIAHLDRDGRVDGDPAVLKGMVCPRVDGCTVELVAQTLEVADRLGLVRWYESNGDRYVSFPKFAKNQPGLRVNREPESDIPPPPSDNPPQTAGTLPEECRQPAGTLPAEGKGREEKGSRREEKEKAPPQTAGGVPPYEPPVPQRPLGDRISLSSGQEINPDVGKVIDAYGVRHPKRKGSARKPEVMTLVRARLADGFSVEDLTEAIDGNLRADFYAAKGLHDLKRIVESADAVERFRKLGKEAAAPKLTEANKRGVAAMESWRDRKRAENGP